MLGIDELAVRWFDLVGSVPTVPGSVGAQLHKFPDISCVRREGFIEI